tara:strand:+ start:30 stop:185 length:156 start_codon:yes stop_codon:yes gene_type:complete
MNISNEQSSFGHPFSFLFLKPKKFQDLEGFCNFDLHQGFKLSAHLPILVLE